MSLLLHAPPFELLEGTGFAQFAYVVIFAGLFGYVLRLQFGQRSLLRRIEAAERSLDSTSNEDQ